MIGATSGSSRFVCVEPRASSCVVFSGGLIQTASGSALEPWWPVHETLGVLAVAGELDAVPRGEDHIRAPVVDHGRREEAEPAVVVLLVVPVEEGPAHVPRVLGGSRSGPGNRAST